MLYWGLGQFVNIPPKQNILQSTVSSMGMKFEKLPSAYVFGHRLRLKRCAIFPFVFSDGYGLIEAYKHTS